MECNSTMFKTSHVTDHNKQSQSAEESGKTQENCHNCKEGERFGNSIYCNEDGRFHNLCGKSPCKHFVSKQ